MAPPEIALRPVALTDLGALDHAYALGEVSDGRLPLLVVRLSGAAGHEDSDPFDLASALVMAGMEAWQPWAVILDLRAFEYRWGDRMQNVLWAPQRWYEPIHPLRAVFTGGTVPKEFPVAVVTSELNREGLESLVRDEMKLAPEKLLHTSIEDAAQALGSLLAGVPLM
jgi:hypothetical protein